MPFIREARKRSSKNRNRLVRFLTRSRVNRSANWQFALRLLFHYFRLFRILIFAFHLEKLELAPGRGIYAEANLCGFVASRAEMCAALGRIADRIALHRDRRRCGG